MLTKPNFDIPTFKDFEKEVLSEIVNTGQKVLRLIDEQVSNLPDGLVEYFDNVVHENPDDDTDDYCGFYPDENWNENTCMAIFSDSDVKHLNNTYNLNFSADDYCTALGLWIISDADLEIISAIRYKCAALDHDFQHTIGFSDFDIGFFITLNKKGDQFDFNFGAGEWTLDLKSLSRILPDFETRYSELMSQEPLTSLAFPKSNFPFYEDRIDFSERTITINDDDFNHFLTSNQGDMLNNQATINQLISQFNEYDLYGKTIPDDYDFLRNLTHSLCQRPFELVAARLGAEKSDSITHIFDRLQHIYTAFGDDVCNAKVVAESITYHHFKDTLLFDNVDELYKFSQHPLTKSIPALFDYIDYSQAEINDCYQSLSLANSIDNQIQDNLLHDELNSRTEEVHFGLKNAL
ncbi:hypothetical protein [Shewanella aestuarii]|uniref:Uncharacterized protein n=1 Tax=Shewanella aestuarii TaxID=1028752 RepID=A0A6G9QPS3_9GAMM|nr:hypothetical protein [Shewanella aestuarii]QIR16590.1 hypothetical protein HBH39_19130 [Shewanella aestuarii]